jgi:malate dehydrogenase (oxaloacetate-decarboxylating)
MLRHPSPSYSITLRVEIENRIGMFARIATAIGEADDLSKVYTPTKARRPLK